MAEATLPPRVLRLHPRTGHLDQESSSNSPTKAAGIPTIPRRIPRPLCTKIIPMELPEVPRTHDVVSLQRALPQGTAHVVAGPGDGRGRGEGREGVAPGQEATNDGKGPGHPGGGGLRISLGCQRDGGTPPGTRGWACTPCTQAGFAVQARSVIGGISRRAGIGRGGEMVDAGDLKSPGSNPMWVRAPPPAPPLPHPFAVDPMRGEPRTRRRTGLLPPTHCDARPAFWNGPHPRIIGAAS